MRTIEELNAHYKAVKERLNAGIVTPKKLVPLPPPLPEFDLVLPPEPVVKLEPRLLSPTQKIIEEVSILTGISVKEIKGEKRSWKYIRARHRAAYELKRQLGLSLPMIGRVLGKRDHTTILSAIKRHAEINNLPQLTSSKSIRTYTPVIKTEQNHEDHHI